MRPTRRQATQVPQTMFPRRLAGAVIAAGGALALAACGGGGGQTAEAPADTPPAEQEAAASPDPTGAGMDSTGESEPTGGGSPTDASALATAELMDADGNSIGQVMITEAETGVQVEVNAEGMEPGFYGFHVHGIGQCEPDSAAPDDPSDTGDFMSAGSHIAGEEGAEHPSHAGDLPNLLVNEDGTGQMSVVTDRLDESLLLDEDGSAMMVHSDPDNYANIPERYAPEGPDEDTTSTGDAGDRLACGVIEE